MSILYLQQNLTLSDWIKERRVELLREILLVCWTEMDRLRTANSCFRRQPFEDYPDQDTSEFEDCQAINLGSLSRQFPNLRDPRKAPKCDPQSIVYIVDAIKNIRHLREMSGLAGRFVAQHTDCDIGDAIYSKVDEQIKALKGRSLVDRYKPALPIWLEGMLAELGSSYPDAKLQTRLCKAAVPPFSDPSSTIRTADENHTPHYALIPLPCLVCQDCLDEWVFLGPEKIGSTIEDHLKSPNHLESVERRLDTAWQATRRDEVNEKHNQY